MKNDFHFSLQQTENIKIYFPKNTLHKFLNQQANSKFYYYLSIL